jgi:hypothetical protein
VLILPILSQGVVHISYLDNENGGICQPDCNMGEAGCGVCKEEVFYRQVSPDGALGNEVQMTCNPPDQEEKSWAPSIAVKGNKGHVVYFEDPHEVTNSVMKFEIYHKQSNDGGNIGLGCEIQATHISSYNILGVESHWRPVVAIDAKEDAHVAWYGATTNNYSNTEAALLYRRQVSGSWSPVSEIFSGTSGSRLLPLNIWRVSPTISVKDAASEVLFGFENRPQIEANPEIYSIIIR